MCMYLLVSCQYLHAASHSCRGLRHHSPKHAWPQGGVLQTGRVRSAWRARLRQPPVLHQHVGHGLAHGLPCCRPLKNKTNFKTNGPFSFALQHVMLNVAQLHTLNHSEQWWSVDTCKYKQIHAHRTCKSDHVFGCMKYSHTDIIQAHTCKYIYIDTHSKIVTQYMLIDTHSNIVIHTHRYT